MATIGVLGSGEVGRVLAEGFLKHGFEVMRGTREPGKLSAWREKAGIHAKVGTFLEASRFGEIVVLALKGDVAVDVVRTLGPDTLAGKVVLDPTNPIAATPPTHGVLSFFTTPNASLMEQLQHAAPKAHFVKCFSCVGNALMVNPDLGGQRPSMFICGNDEGAKRRTKEILDKFGWESEDCGAVEAARAIEPLCMLWCIPGFLRNDWMHAYKVLRPKA
ncbi:MAG: NADPH-dependent F420 reductase [Myxococcaceae bacterium]